MTPMQEQYNRIKEEYSDHIVLFRLGDFFEAFNDDAIQISKVLGITLTGRGKGDTRHPMAGIPHHALPNYLPKLVEAGLKIAIADQMEEAQPGKLVERQITKIITPGTVIDENSLEASKNNYIAALYIQEQNSNRGNGKQLFHLVYSDLTTGELRAFSTDNALVLRNELNKVTPAEILVSESQYKTIKTFVTHRLEMLEDTEFESNDSKNILFEQFDVQSLKGFGIEEEDIIIRPAAALIQYLRRCQKTTLKHIRSIQKYDYSNFMHLDSETIRNLELLYPITGSDTSNTVYEVLDHCKNPMGKRKLRKWLLHPLTNAEILNERLNAVEYFFNNPILTGEVRELLNSIADIERVVGRLGVGSANPKDLMALVISIEKIEAILTVINQSSEELPARVSFLIRSIAIEDLNKVKELINSAIKEDPPAMINEGGIINDGFNERVDELRNIRRNAKNILQEIQEREIQNTGISSLKISFNKVFGYYIEITKSNLSKVPDSYIRKQTLANAERYITQELKDLEDKILSSEEKLIELELQLFIEVREAVSEYIKQLLHTGDVLAELDILNNFGYIARQYQYVKPEIISSEGSDHNDNILEIKKGRHPVVERITKEFIPNDVEFSNNSTIHILTGPNMSGKSTFIRQVALITLLAQVGTFVPAESMKFNIVDRIFTRVGASDNLAKGESTFMVEMTETANILNNATNKSLVILDEVGRGTSTYDGVAIAWSIIEYICKEINCKTLFATHYHELIELENKHSSISNYNVLIKDDEGEITFKHKIVKGGTNKSYGVHVAKIAGVPEAVVKRANEILEDFESSDNEVSKNVKASGSSKLKDEDIKTVENKKRKESIKRSPSKPKRIHPEQLGLI